MSLRRRLGTLEGLSKGHDVGYIQSWLYTRYKDLGICVLSQSIGGKRPEASEPVHYKITGGTSNTVLHTGLADTYTDAWAVGRQWVDSYVAGEVTRSGGKDLPNPVVCVELPSNGRDYEYC